MGCVGGLRRTHLFMVLDAHADSVDQDSDHDASVEVLALHDAPQLDAHLHPHTPAAALARPPLNLPLAL